MGKGSAPAAPDPYASANAQTGLNKDTAIANANLGHVNQFTPFGNLTWQQTGSNQDGTPQYSATTQLSPDLQNMYSQQMQQDLGLTNTANGLISQVNNNISKPIDTSGTSPVIGGFTGQQLADINSGYSHSAGPAAQANSYQAPVTHAAYGQIMDQMQGGTNFGQQVNDAQHAAYNNQMMYLQPEQADARAQLTNQLSQQGITADSNPQAYQHAMDQLNRDQTFQNQGAYNTSFGAGLQAQNQLFGQNLSSSQFANAAQQQGFDQSAWNAGQDNASALQYAGAQDAASLANAQAQNQMAQFNTGTNNAAVNSMFGNAVSNAGMSNAANAQQMQNLFALRNAPMNELSSIRSATPVSSPQFQNYSGGTMNPANLMQAQQAAYQGQLGAYNNQQSGLFGLGGAGLMALGSGGDSAMLSHLLMMGGL